MATLVRDLSKIALFIGVFLLSVRFIPIPDEWSLAETRAWIRASDRLGIEDPESLYFMVWLTIELIVAVLAYAAILSLWRRCRR